MVELAGLGDGMRLVLFTPRTLTKAPFACGLRP